MRQIPQDEFFVYFACLPSFGFTCEKYLRWRTGQIAPIKELVNPKLFSRSFNKQKLWQVFWLVPFIMAFPLLKQWQKENYDKPRGTYSCGYSSGFAPDSHIKVAPEKVHTTN